MKKILITGAGSGIGKEVAITLAKRGHLVYATTHHKDQSDALKQISKELNLPYLKSFKLDILCAEDRFLVDDLDIDVLINNAAIGDSGSVAETPVNRFRTTFETNVFSALELTQLVMKNMITKGHGRIIFISSLVGRITIPFLSPYTSTKFAIECLATSLKDEMKELENAKIHVILIEPGAYATGFNQENIAKQFTWMYKSSYFKNKLDYLRAKQFNFFKTTEIKSLNSIVNEYVKAVEDEHPKSRYVSPILQGVFIQLQRILGK